MNVQEYINKVAHQVEWCPDPSVEPTKAWASNFDGSFIIPVGMEDELKYYAEREITDELTHGVGFSPKDNKWYGWTHRGMYGFEMGSRCKKGDCHYSASNKEDFMRDRLKFWGDDDFKADNAVVIDTTRDGIKGCLVTGNYNFYPKNESLRYKKYEHFTPYPETFGRGEWVAETMEDAKQMAIDFRNGVS